MNRKFNVKSALLCTAMSVAASGAHAGPSTTVDVFGPSGLIAADVFEFDWNSGSNGIAIGKGPIGSAAGAVGTDVRFLWMSNLVSFNDIGTNPITPLAGLNAAFASGGYEFTAVIDVVETITSLSAPPGGGPGTVTFGDPLSGTFSIFYDDASAGGIKANQTAGGTGGLHGYDDGIEIARFGFDGGTSSFTLFPGTPLQGNGGTQYHADIAHGPGGFVNSAFIQGLIQPVFDMHFTSSQNYPPTANVPDSFFDGTSTGGAPANIYPTYVVDKTCSAPGVPSCDLVLKVDGSTTFSVVPEPATVLMMGVGLLSMGFARRKGAAG
jgi:hypothetical protein